LSLFLLLLLFLLFFLSFPQGTCCYFVVVLALAVVLAFLSVIPAGNLLLFFILAIKQERLQLWAKSFVKGHDFSRAETGHCEWGFSP